MKRPVNKTPYPPAVGWRLPGDGRHPIAWRGRTLVMGVLNLTPDSFYGGSRLPGPEAALDRALRMKSDGADLIDLGGESTRPGARPVSAAEEMRRVIPVVRLLAKKAGLPVSIDTSKASVAEAAVGAGASILNDVGALGLDPRMAGTAAKLKVPVVLMHMKGRPRTMQKDPRYGDVVAEVGAFLRRRMEAAERAGVDPLNLVLDPGFGFGKAPFHNLELTRRLDEIGALGRPILFGPSRKATLGVLLGGAPPQDRLEATLALVTAAVLGGADWVRVHDVKETARAVRMADALRYGRGCPAP